MQWSTEPFGGFTKSERPVAPVISSGPYGFEHVNVADQRRDPNSFLNWMERIIRMRKEVPEIGFGDFVAVRTGANEVLALRYDWRRNSVLFVHNLSASPRETTIEPGIEGRHDGLLVNLLSGDHSEPDEKGRHRILLEPYGYRWFRVGGLDYLLKRSEI